MNLSALFKVKKENSHLLYFLMDEIFSNHPPTNELLMSIRVTVFRSYRRILNILKMVVIIVLLIIY